MKCSGNEKLDVKKIVKYSWIPVKILKDGVESA